MLTAPCRACGLTLRSEDVQQSLCSRVWPFCGPFGARAHCFSNDYPAATNGRARHSPSCSKLHNTHPSAVRCLCAFVPKTVAPSSFSLGIAIHSFVFLQSHQSRPHPRDLSRPRPAALTQSWRIVPPLSNRSIDQPRYEWSHGLTHSVVRSSSHVSPLPCHPRTPGSVIRPITTRQPSGRTTEATVTLDMFNPLLSAGGAKPTVSQEQYAAAALTSPAIPATPDEGTGAAFPGAKRRADTSSNEACHSFFDASLPQPFPLPSASPQLPATPALDDQPHLDLSFAGTFLPTDVSLPSPTLARTAPNFRLPSFDVLGIAAPHPDRIPLHPTYSFSSLGAGPLSKPEDPLHALSPPLEFRRQAEKPAVPPVASPKATRKQVEHQVPTFTPPSEPGTFNWGSLVRVRTAGAGSPPSSEPGVSPNFTLTESATGPGQAPIVVPTYTAEISGALRMAFWIQNVKNILSEHHRQPLPSCLLTTCSY